MESTSEHINIERSIEKGRIIRNTGQMDTFMNYLTHIFFIVFALFIGVGLTAGAFQSDKLIVEIIIFVLIPMLVIAYFLLRATIRIDRLEHIQGSTKTENRKRIKSIAESIKWGIDEHKARITVLSPPTDLMTWNRTVVVLYDGDNMYLNTKAGGLFGLQSPFHGISDRKVQEALIKAFNNVQFNH